LVGIESSMSFFDTRASWFVGVTILALHLFHLAGVAQTPRKNVAHVSAKPSTKQTTQSLDELKKLGLEYLDKKDWASADAIFEKALGLRSNDPQSLYGKALALFNLQQIMAAEQVSDRAISIIAESSDKTLLVRCLVLSAVISAVQNKSSEAIEKLERAVKLVPTDFDANLSLGRAYFGNGDMVAAITAFRRAVAILPNHLQAKFFLATALERDGQYAEALKEYREIIRLDPNSADGNLGLGVLLIKTEGDNSDEGLAALKKAVALNDRLYEGQITLGKTLVKLNKTADALPHLKKAAELAPNNPEPHFQLSIAYRKLGERDKADAETEIVKRIHETRRGLSEQPRP